MVNTNLCLTIALTLLVKYKITDVDVLNESIKKKELQEHLESLYVNWKNQNKELEE